MDRRTRLASHVASPDRGPYVPDAMYLKRGLLTPELRREMAGLGLEIQEGNDQEHIRVRCKHLRTYGSPQKKQDFQRLVHILSEKGAIESF